MKKSLLRAALAVLAAGPAAAAVPTAPTPAQENLEQFADLSQNARTAARLENANQDLSRGYDASAAAPAVAAAADTPTKPGLEQAPPEQGIHYIQPPDIAPDKAPADTSAEDAKKKKDLQRDMIGGAGGAAVLAVFGFIFGGPVGALLGAGLGFALLAGVTHLNNHPIDG